MSGECFSEAYHTHQALLCGLATKPWNGVDDDAKVGCRTHFANRFKALKALLKEVTKQEGTWLKAFKSIGGNVSKLQRLLGPGLQAALAPGGTAAARPKPKTVDA